jgi:hypothetical protein
MSDEKKGGHAKTHHVTDGPIFAILSPRPGDTVSQVFNVIGTSPSEGKTITVTITPTGDTALAVVSDKTWIAAFDPAQPCDPATITATGPDANSPQSITNIHILDNPFAVFEIID